MIDLNALPLPELYAELARTGLVRRLVELARDEDLGTGDVTSLAMAPAGATCEARVVARQEGVVAGLAAIEELRTVFAPGCAVRLPRRDGDAIAPGDELARVTGPLREALALERTMLNLLSRLSGVATLTRAYAEALARGDGTGTPVRARLYDTRKTTPGMRVLEKYAVRCGDGLCHRIGLFDAVLVKDNHVAGVPVERLGDAIVRAAGAARRAGDLRFVEVEVDSLDQLDALLALPAGVVDIALLDNMDGASLREAVRRRDARRPGMELEASGGVTLATIGPIGATGVDRVSVGALTHSAVALDIGLDI